MYFLWKAGIVKLPVFVDGDGQRHEMIYPPPRWLTKAQKPLKWAKETKQHFEEKNQYGPPYIENPEMQKEFYTEISSSNFSLASVHDCLTSKIDPNNPDRDRKSNRGLHYAARYGDPVLALLLVRAGSRVNVKNSLGQTPLMIAAGGKWSGHTAVVRLLIALGATVNDKDRGGSTALVYAVLSSAVSNVGILLHHEATVESKERKYFRSADPEALAIAKFCRSYDNQIDLEGSDEYFALRAISGPTVLEVVFGIGVRSNSARVVDMLESALAGTFINTYEIHLLNAAWGVSYLWNRFVKGKDMRKVQQVVVKKKILQVQKYEEFDWDTVQSARLRMRELKVELEKKRIAERNLMAARKEISEVQSQRNLDKLFGRKAVGKWVRVEAAEDEKLKDPRYNAKTHKKSGKSEPKAKWEFRDIEPSKTMFTKLDETKIWAGADLYVAPEPGVGTASEEQSRMATMERLAAKLQALDGVEIKDIKTRQREWAAIDKEGMSDMAASDESKGHRKEVKKVSVVKVDDDGEEIEVIELEAGDTKRTILFETDENRVRTDHRTVRRKDKEGGEAEDDAEVEEEEEERSHKKKHVRRSSRNKNSKKKLDEEEDNHENEEEEEEVVENKSKEAKREVPKSAVGAMKAKLKSQADWLAAKLAPSAAKFANNVPKGAASKILSAASGLVPESASKIISVASGLVPESASKFLSATPKIFTADSKDDEKGKGQAGNNSDDEADPDDDKEDSWSDSDEDKRARKKKHKRKSKRHSSRAKSTKDDKSRGRKKTVVFDLDANEISVYSDK